jgi:hypothetical protein
MAATNDVTFECPNCEAWVAIAKIAKHVRVSAPGCVDCGVPMRKSVGSAVDRGVPVPPPGVLKEINAALQAHEDAFVAAVVADYRAHPDDA